MLISLIYTLANTTPNFEKWVKETISQNIEYSTKALKLAKNKETRELSNILTTILKNTLNNLAESIAENIKKNLTNILDASKIEEVLDTPIIVEDTETKIKYEITQSGEKLEFKFEGIEKIKMHVEEVEKFMDEIINININITVNDNTLMKTELKVEYDTAEKLILDIMSTTTPPILRLLFSPLSLGANHVFLPADSRAGIQRLAPAALRLAPTYGKLLIPAREAEYIKSQSILLALAAREKDEEASKILKPLLRDLGVEEFKIEPVEQRIYVKDIYGQKLPLEKCSSGIRETIPLILALIAKLPPHTTILVEEPEAHLHPTALKKLIEAIFKITCKNKYFTIITTHNPITLTTLNNIILKTGNHNIITIAYLKEEEGKVKLEEIPVTKEGFDETALTHIFEELLKERAEALRE